MAGQRDYYEVLGIPRTASESDIKKAFRAALDETGVAFLPGKAFGRPDEELTVRIAYVDFDGARALAASEQIPLDQDIGPDFIEIYCHNTKRGIELLCEWVESL